MNDLVTKYAALQSLVAEIAAETADAHDDETVAQLAIDHHTVVRQFESIGNQRILEVSDRDAHRAVGCVTVTEFLQTKLRITHPKKRLQAVQALEPMHAMTGEKLPPVCPNTARELAAGTIGPDHVHAVLDVLAKIPAAVDAEQRARAEQTLAEFATTLTPREIGAAGVRLLAHLDPDGQLTDDRDRARNRKLNLGCQDSQLMSKLTATLDPITRALFDVVVAKWAAPGMNNPDDDQSPKGDHGDADPELLKEAADRDYRSQSQRNHDAFKALLEAAVNGGLLGGSHRGLPPQIIVSITDAQLREHAGVARTAAGSDLPISDVVKLAADAQPHLAVFSDVTNEPLFFGRSQRLASQAQRLMAFAQYKGCSKDDCGVPFAHTEMHHAEADWSDGGLTDAPHLAPACGRHNRAVGSEPHQWSTEKITEGPDRGRYGWRRNTDPPEKLRANHLHRIDELLHQDSPDILEPPPTVSDIEHQLAHLAAERRPRAPRIDIVWPRWPITWAA
ncbi:HNH endonuclease signature motif containing protein [Williamsia herbipolensis]|uniref:HNH endonuclease signature motif containing protein n=1 Tax=Williamsia herbipolensis TaxID=1603258 RepID=UPI000AF7BDF5|nr:HNH endonuclease signature motif containing protein [Williamsia herbipolensis]